MNLRTVPVNNCFSWLAHSFVYVAILTISLLFIQPAYSAETAAFEPLNDAQLKSLGGHLQAMKALAPAVRIALRSMRMNINFEVREIYNIERSLGKVPIDIERIIAMHGRGKFNKVRAHFIADDLRRKAGNLDQGLAYVTMQIEKKYVIAMENDSEREKLSEQDNQLLSLLEEYGQLVKRSLQVISGEMR